jgi:hypothetical protein
MSAQHTPGPWLVEAKNCHTGDIATVHNTDDEWVTIYAPRWMETGLDKHEQSANARLIAAAPDLLAALKTLVKAGGIGPESMFEDARDAIAKAERRAA